MKKTVVFDFDKTLTYTDSLFGFYRYTSGLRPKTVFVSVVYFLLMVLAKFKLISLKCLKNKGVKLFLSGCDRETFFNRCADYSKRIDFNKVFHEDYISLSNTENVIIISASFIEYLGPIFKDVQLIGSTIELKNNSPFKVGKHCYGREKVKMLKEKGIDRIDLFYTDSISDLPLAEISNQIVVVKGDKKVVCDSVEEFKMQFK